MLLPAVRIHQFGNVSHKPPRVYRNRGFFPHNSITILYIIRHGGMINSLYGDMP
jgi:hypothetical protein